MRAALLRVVLAAMLAAPAGALAQDYVCPEVKVAPIALPHVRQRLGENRQVMIVALGSSSTEGAMSSNIGHTYPRVLQYELGKALPQAHFSVVNRGIGGEDAPEELARMQRDALALRPTLVIWQVGANGAMKGTDPELFKRLVDSGVKQLLAAGADVVLMDNQRSPKILASPDHAKMDQALADISQRDGALLFMRGRLMDLWQDAGHPYGEFLATDGIHMNDRGYACVAKTLASEIVNGLGPQTDGLRASR